MRTGNPALNANTFENFGVYRQDAAVAPTGTMTILGTVHKTLFLLALAIGAACFTWSRTAALAEAVPGGAVGSAAGWVMGGGLVALVAGVFVVLGLLASLLLPRNAARVLSEGYAPPGG